MIGILLMIIGVILGFIGMCLDPDSDFLPLTFIAFIAFLASGLILTILGSI